MTHLDSVAIIIYDMLFKNTDAKNLDSILKNSEIEITYFENPDVESFLTWNSQTHRPTISISESLSTKHVDAATIHELIHLILDWNWHPPDILNVLGQKPDIHDTGIHITFEGRYLLCETHRPDFAYVVTKVLEMYRTKFQR